MAIATPSLVTSGNSAAGTTATTASVTLTAGKLYLLGITGRRGDSTNVPAPDSVVRGAQSFTIVDATLGLQQYDDSSSSRRALWVGYCVPASDTTGTIVATWSASLSRKQWILVEVASGFDSGAPIQQVAGNKDTAGSGSSLTATFGSAISTGGAVVGFFADSGATGLTPGDDYVELVEVQNAGEMSLSGSYDLTPDTTFTYTYTNLEQVGAVAVEIKAAASGTTTNKTLSATVTSTPTMVRQVGKPIARTVTSTPSIVKSVSKPFSRTVTSTPTMVRSVGKPLSVVSTATVSTSRSVAKALTVTSTAAVSLLKSVTKTFSVTSTATATLAASKAYLRTLSVTVTSTPSMVRSVGKVLSVTVTSAPTVARSISKTFAVTVTATASLTKSIGKTLSAVVSTVASLAHVFQAGSNVEAPGYAFLSDEPTARASVFDSRMAIATLSDAVVGRAEVMDGGA